MALVFPKLRARYGPSVNYAQDKKAHGQVELAFDANQFARGRLAPSKYLHEIGLKVPRRQLAAAFYETYGLTAKEVMGRYEPVMRTYRFGARIFLPSFVYAEALLHRHRFPPDTAGPEFDEYERACGFTGPRSRVAALFEKTWHGFVYPSRPHHRSA